MLSKRFRAMYKVLDIIVDGNTIDFLSLILTIVVHCAAVAFGWYGGSLISIYDKPVTKCL